MKRKLFQLAIRGRNSSADFSSGRIHQFRNEVYVEFAVDLWYNNSVYGFYSRTPGDSSVNKMRKDV